MGWFRKKSKGVSPDMIAASRAILRDVENFDVDDFFDHATVAMLDEPLGDSPDCLSANEVAIFVAHDKLSAARRLHAGACPECAEMIRIYREACKEEWTGLSDLDIIRAEEIRIPSGGEFYVIIANHGSKHVLQLFDENTIEATGAIQASGCQLEKLDPKPYRATEAVKLTFRKHKVMLPDAFQSAVPGWLTLSGRSQKGEPLEMKRFFVNVVQERPAAAAGG